MLIHQKFFRKSFDQHGANFDMSRGWVIISWRIVPDKKMRRKFHGKWVKITHLNKTIFRVISFNGRLIGTHKSSDPSDIVMDWSGWVELNDYAEEVDHPLDITIQPARWYERALAHLKHPDPIAKNDNIMGLVLFILGLIIGALL